MKKILVVDDDPATADILRLTLDFYGFHVLTLAHPEAVFDVIKEFKPDLILLDYLMRGTNGGEVCKSLKNQAETKHLPVIIISAYPMNFDPKERFGCNLFVAKPFDLDDLLAQINKHIL